MAQATTLASLKAPAPLPTSATSSVAVSMDTVAGFEALQRIAKLFASSEIVPKRYRDNMPSCFIAVDMAVRMGANPMLVMQNLYDIEGNPSWSAKFLIATFNKCGRFTAIRYQFQGQETTDEWGCRAVSNELSTGETIIGPLITIGLAKKEGWFRNKKWQTVPELMLRYRAAAWMVNTYAPEIAMGLRTVEEEQDKVYDITPDTNGTFHMTTEEIRRPVPAEEEAEAQQPEPSKQEKNPPRPRKEKVVEPEPPVEVAPVAEEPPAHDPQTGEVFGSSSSMYTVPCPHRDNAEVDEAICLKCPKKPGCPTWAE